MNNMNRGPLGNFFKSLWADRKLRYALMTLAILVVLVGAVNFFDYLLKSKESAVIGTAGQYFSKRENGCSAGANVAGIKLHGNVTTSDSGKDVTDSASGQISSSRQIVDAIEAAEKDANVKAIILDIDSNGGNPTAAEEIADALKKAEKPTIALCRSVCGSAGYWTATGADTIFASKTSDIGGIGVTMSFIDSAQKNQREGFTYNQIIEGRLKDAGATEKPLTPEERAMFQKEAKVLYDIFISQVSGNRKLPIEKVRSLADGATMYGDAALKNGLIDRIGNLSDVRAYLGEGLGEEVEVCW